jgi:glycosyltransferase involved in cell wall biosynthesis
VKKFICLFPTGEDIVLIKDVGMIPFYMYKDGHYDAYISFYKSKDELAYLSSDLKGLNYVQMNNIFHSELLSTFFFLIKNLFKYDVVMLFHPTPYKVLMINIIKLLSFNRTKFYFKIDADYRVVENDLYVNKWSSGIKRFLSKRIDLFSAESQAVCQYLDQRSYYHPVKYIPNGCVVPSKGIDNLVKENIFLTVGRLGTNQKDTETLMEAFALSCMDNNWRLVLVGPREEDFERYLISFFRRHPWAIGKIDLPGAIYNREQLNAIYQKSAVFVLTSRYESFGLVLLEAMIQGCYILSTALPPSKDILKDDTLGKTFPIEDSKELAKLMAGIVDNTIILPEPKHIQEYVINNYSWSIVVEKIASYLKKDIT